MTGGTGAFVVFEGYAAAAVPGVEAGMNLAVEANAIVFNATLEAHTIRVLQQLDWMLLMLCKNTALQIHPLSCLRNSSIRN